MREFYSNIVERKKKTCYVRGKWVSFNRDEIYKLLKMSDLKDGLKFKKPKKDLDYQKILEFLTIGKGELKGTKKNPFDSIAKGSLTEEAKVWFYFLNSVMMPSKHPSTVRKEEVMLLYAILKGYNMNANKIIEKFILNCYYNNFRGLIPHLSSITTLCIMGRVKFDFEEEERCPKTPLLTLTTIIKPPFNKSKEKVKDIEEE